MARVAIIGTCITRDMWPLRGETAQDHVLYVSRTSLPSLLSAPMVGFEPAAERPAALKNHQHKALVSDLKKQALAQLVAYRPTHLIFDMMDERFDLLQVGGSVVTESWELAVSGYQDGPAFEGARRISRLSAAADAMWAEAAAEFGDLVRSTPLCEAQLILHVSRWAPVRLGADGVTRPLTDIEVLPGRAAEVPVHNDLLARYESLLTAALPPMARVEAPDHRVADESHKWGLGPFHYIPAYYEVIWRQLQALGVEA